jgi:hypothetical protein
MWQRMYWSGSSSRHFLRFLSNIFKKQSRNLCFTPLLFAARIFKNPVESIIYDVAEFSREWRSVRNHCSLFFIRRKYILKDLLIRCFVSDSFRVLSLELVWTRTSLYVVSYFELNCNLTIKFKLIMFF